MNKCKYCDGSHKPKDCPQDFGGGGSVMNEKKKIKCVSCNKREIYDSVGRCIICNYQEMLTPNQQVMNKDQIKAEEGWKEEWYGLEVKYKLTDGRIVTEPLVFDREQEEVILAFIKKKLAGAIEECAKVAEDIEYDDEDYVITPVVQRILAKIKALK